MCPCQGSRRAAQAFQSCFPVDLSTWSRRARSSVFSSLTERPAIFQKLSYMKKLTPWITIISEFCCSQRVFSYSTVTIENKIYQVLPLPHHLLFLYPELQERIENLGKYCTSESWFKARWPESSLLPGGFESRVLFLRRVSGLVSLAHKHHQSLCNSFTIERSTKK